MRRHIEGFMHRTIATFLSVLTLVSVVASCGDKGSIETGAQPSAATRAAQEKPDALGAACLSQEGASQAYHFVSATAGAVSAQNPQQRLGVEVSGGALHLTLGARRLGLRWTALGRNRDLAPVMSPESEAEVAGNRATYWRADRSAEWYLNGPLGVEQGFLIAERPAGSEERALTIEVSVDGDLAPELEPSGRAVTLHDAHGAVAARYAGLSAVDAAGAPLSAWLEVEGAAIRLRVSDAGARYPLYIDPIVWTQGIKLTASDQAPGDDFGYAVAVSGGVAVVGALSHGPQPSAAGAAYVFVQNGTTWTQQAELTPSDPSPAESFGQAVAVADGVVVVGAPHWGGAGAAYVFVQNGTTWTQQAELTDSTVDGAFGTSVAVGGGVVVVGATNPVGNGAAYVFAQNGTTWTQQAKLTPSDSKVNDQFGASAALSGGTLVVGAPNAYYPGLAYRGGAAYAFVQTGTIWTQQYEFSGHADGSSDHFGASVSVDGDTVLVGAPWEDNGIGLGTAYVFARTGTMWTQEAKLVTIDPNAMFFGSAVSVSGGTALVGAPQWSTNPGAQIPDNEGAVYVYARSGTQWAQQALLTVTPIVDGNLGSTLSLSGSTAVIGGSGEQAAYVFYQSGANGATCSAGSDCVSGFCVGNVCCSSACNGGSCQVCSIAAGATVDGTCALLTGKPCDDGDACTQSDTCQAGVCTGSNPVACAALDACHVAGTCNPGTGMCSNPNQPNGTPCNDGNACTQTDSCQAGICTGFNPVTCPMPDACHTVAPCDKTTGMCAVTQKLDGAACGDGNACTQSDSCQAGVCTGTNPVVCPPPDQCHMAGVCDVTTGICSNPAKADGTSCDDGNACTQTDTCQAGACKGESPVVCAALDQCHDVGTCDPATGMCSNPAKADNAPCDDGDACTTGDVCKGGTCMSGNLVTCQAKDECHSAGTCDPSSGMCSNPQKASGTPCSGGKCEGGKCTMSGTGGAGSGGGSATGSGGLGTGGVGGSAPGSGGLPTETGGGSNQKPHGCSCRTVGGEEGARGAPLLALLLAALIRRRDGALTRNGLARSTSGAAAPQRDAGGGKRRRRWGSYDTSGGHVASNSRWARRMSSTRPRELRSTARAGAFSLAEGVGRHDHEQARTVRARDGDRLPVGKHHRGVRGNLV
jgi:MYXO-CTERM domain-containing protein